MKPRAAFRDTCPGPLALCGRFARERHTAPFVLTPQMDGVSIKLREPRVGRSQPALLPVNLLIGVGSLFYRCLGGILHNRFT